MANDKPNKDVFQELSEYIGEAVKIVRRVCRKSKSDLAGLLSDQNGWGDATEELIYKIETGERRLSFEEFVDICDAIGYSVKQILECAKMIKEESEK